MRRQMNGNRVQRVRRPLHHIPARPAMHMNINKPRNQQPVAGIYIPRLRRCRIVPRFQPDDFPRRKGNGKVGAFPKRVGGVADQYTAQ